MAVTVQQLTQLYLAYFGRPPDFDGVQFYTANPNASVASVAAAFSASPESQSLYGTAFGSAQVNAIYRVLFNRDAEPSGLAYWTQEVAAGRLTPAMAAYGILVGAQNADLTAVNNKMTIATAFYNALDTSAEITGYSGAAAASSARTFLGTVTSDAATVTSAQAAVNTQVAAAVSAGQSSGGGTGVAGLTFTLTAGAQTFAPNSSVQGTATTPNDDWFRSVDNGLDTTDFIDGGAGNDRLTVTGGGTAKAATAGGADAADTTANVIGNVAPVINSVEIIKIDVDTSATATGSATNKAAETVTDSYTLNMSAVTGAREVYFSGNTITAKAVGDVAGTAATAGTASATQNLSFTNVKLGTIVGLEDITTTETVTAAKDSAAVAVSATFGFSGATGAADAATVRLADVQSGGANTVTVDAIESLTLNSIAGSVAAISTNVVDTLAGSTLDTLTITGTQGLTLAAINNSGNSLGTITATDFTGALNLTFTSVKAGTTTINSGSGADTLTLTAGAATQKFALNAGAGNDTIVLTAAAQGASTIATGAGADTVRITERDGGADNLTASAISTAANLEAAAIVITDFTDGSDVLRLTGSGGAQSATALTGTQMANVAASANLLAATNAAAALVAAGDEGTWFEFGGSTYVLVQDAAGTTVNANDLLIKIAGVTGLNAQDIVFF